MSDIENSGAKNEIKNSSIISLDDTIRDISKTSGGHIGKLQLDVYKRQFHECVCQNEAIWSYAGSRNG